jgi:hypothetical protein
MIEDYPTEIELAHQELQLTRLTLEDANIHLRLFGEGNSDQTEDLY